MGKISFQKACASYVHRYTMDHVPEWARAKGPEGAAWFYAPQYRSDREWYDLAVFPGEKGYPFGKRCTDCYSGNPTWPLGMKLARPYPGLRPYQAPDDIGMTPEDRRALEIDRAKDDCGEYREGA